MRFQKHFIKIQKIDQTYLVSVRANLFMKKLAFFINIVLVFSGCGDTSVTSVTSVTQVALPPEILSLQDVFASYYVSKHNGRRLQHNGQRLRHYVRQQSQRESNVLERLLSTLDMVYELSTVIL